MKVRQLLPLVDVSTTAHDSTDPATAFTRFPNRILDWDPCVCIVGVGFVGESLLRRFGSAYACIGFDISAERIRALSSRFEKQKNVQLTSQVSRLALATHYFISVPTLLNEDNSVDFTYVNSAIDTVLQYARPGSCIVIESSVPIGTTRRLLGPYVDLFYCGMSPERIDPGRTSPSAAEIPKVVSGLTPLALKKITAMYSRVFDTVVPVSKPEVAEMTKLYENCYRMVNIAYVNEISDACRSHNIDPHEMINAAATKPFGFQAFQPGLGVGGHCIPINPYYLFANNKNLPILKRATNLMLNRPRKLAKRFYKRLMASICATGQVAQTSLPRILIVGIGFKAGQSELSASPGLAFAKGLAELGCARLAYHDPLVNDARLDWLEKLNIACWNSTYIESEFDAVAICNRQDKVDLAILEGFSKDRVHYFV